MFCCRSNSTLVSGSAKQVDTIAEDENFKKSPQTCVISQNESQNVGNTRRKSTTKSLSMSDSAASSQADFSEPPRSNPYLTLSQEEYTQHKSHILHCKFSKDGKYIASVDAQGVIKSSLQVFFSFFGFKILKNLIFSLVN